MVGDDDDVALGRFGHVAYSLAKVGEEAWQTHAADLRESATSLARAAAARDYLQARTALAGVANACNRCHQTFRVGVRVDPFADAP